MARRQRDRTARKAARSSYRVQRLDGMTAWGACSPWMLAKARAPS